MFRMLKILRSARLWRPALALAALVLSAPLLTAQEAEAPPEPRAGESPAIEAGPAAAAFTLAEVEQEARELAARNFAKNGYSSKQFSASLPEEKWRCIFFNENKRLWAEDHLPFEAGFFHPGFIYDQPPEIFIVEAEGPRKFDFSADFFSYPDVELRQQAQQAKIGFAGFRLNYPLNDAAVKDEVLSFLGATHFRALARHARYGLEARGLILNPAAAGGEEYPYFRRFWLVRPDEADEKITIYALLDSPSLTGAYRFALTPGPSTVMDVSARLFKRDGQNWPEKIGLGPMGSMYLFSEREGSAADWRPEVHNSDGLLWVGPDGRFFNRPLANPRRLNANAFELPDPRGFGLMQLDANFDHYQDLKARFELKPSLWVEPAGDWGPGRLELLEIPAAQEIHNNIIAFWTPEKISGEAFAFDYRLYWMPAGAAPHQLGRAAATRLAEEADGALRFIIDFEGGRLKDIPAESGLSSLVECSPEATVAEKMLVKNPVTNGWRLEFKIKPPESGMMENLMATRNGQKILRIKAELKLGENLPDALTETWVYDLPY